MNAVTGFWGIKKSKKDGFCSTSGAERGGKVKPQT